MEKRLIFAIALSMLVLLTWSRLAPKTQPVVSKEVTTQKPLPQAALKQESAPIPIDSGQQGPPLALFKYNQEKLEATFIEPQAAIKELFFKPHKNDPLNLKNGFLLAGQNLNFKKVSSNPESIIFSADTPDKKIIKRFIFSNAGNELWLEINVQNTSATPMAIDLPIILGSLDISPNTAQARYQDVTVATREKTLHLNGKKEGEFPELKFICVRDRYFCAIIAPQENNYTGFIRKVNGQGYLVGLQENNLTLAAGQNLVRKFHIYLGTQDLQLINRIQPEWSAVIYYGTFDFIAQILLQLLRWVNSIVHNWGWTIVIFSLLVYFLLFPLSLKQMRSMKDMQALQPRIEALRSAYKDNPQKLNKEIMVLYKEHKVNPFGGCLPLLLQMPIFFALYQVLMRSVFLKGASFLWIKDLSEPDRLFLLPTSLPIIGNEINILPIVMAIAMFIQQKTSQVAASSEAAQQQKIMLIVFPVMFGFIFYKMPSGLVLYWFINSTLMLLYQLKLKQSK